MSKHRIIAAALLSLTVAMSGCATRTPMAFAKDSERLDGNSKPVYLLSATIRNEYHTRFQPRLIVVHVQRPGADNASDRLNFVMDDKARVEADSDDNGTDYLLRLALDRGRYELPGMSALGRAFPVIGSFFVPVHATIDVTEPGVYYLGHVNGTVRERQGNEFRAGPPLPLIDQAIAGASGGTFDVEISDAWATDEAMFRKTFPALTDVPVRKAILPPFDRARAQAWWEAH